MLINLIIWLSYSKRKMKRLQYRDEIELNLVRATNETEEKTVMQKQLDDFDGREKQYRDRMYIYVIVVCVLTAVLSVFLSIFLAIISMGVLENVFHITYDVYTPSNTWLSLIPLDHLTNIITTILLLYYLKNDKLK